MSPEYVYRVRFRVLSSSRWRVCSIGRLKSILRTHPNSDIEIQRALADWQEVSRDDIA